MTDPGPPTPPLEGRNAKPRARRAYQLGVVTTYFESNRGSFTEDALVQAARAQGYSDDVVDEARLRARANEASGPIRHRARRWIQVAYLVTFAVLAIGMLANESQRYMGSLIWFAFLALALTLGFALLASFAWLRGRRTVGVGPGGIVLLLSVPVVLLVTVAGLCVASGLPIPRPA
jgi:hypothetical protein